MNKSSVLNQMAAYLFEIDYVTNMDYPNDGISFSVMSSDVTLKVKHFNFWLFNILYIKYDIFGGGLRQNRVTEWFFSWGTSAKYEITKLEHITFSLIYTHIHNEIYKI